jgi:nucleoside-diphosphate-sugar epimerase
MKKVLITGAAGLIGLIAVDHFRQAGWRVTATDLASRVPAGGDDLVAWRPLDLADLAPADVEGLDAVVHLGALTLSAERRQVGGRTVLVDARDMLAVNVLGTETLFRLASQASVPCVVWASTAGVYGRPPGDLDAGYASQQGPFRPGSLYAHTKLMCEGLARHYADSSSTRFVGMRPTFSYGLGRLTGISGAFAAFIADAISGRPAVLTPPFGASGRLQLIYVDDMARSLVSCAELALSAGADIPRAIVLNSPTRELLTIARIVELLREITGNDQVSVQAEHFSEEMVMPLMDTTTAAGLLGFEQRYPFTDAVRDMAEKIGRPL